MEVKEIQNKSNEIVELIDKKLNVNHDENKTILHVLEEFGELTRQINNQNIRNIVHDENNIQKIPF